MGGGASNFVAKEELHDVADKLKLKHEREWTSAREKAHRLEGSVQESEAQHRSTSEQHRSMSTRLQRTSADLVHGRTVCHY